jgi:hypothetical protein
MINPYFSSGAKCNDLVRSSVGEWENLSVFQEVFYQEDWGRESFNSFKAEFYTVFFTT